MSKICYVPKKFQSKRLTIVKQANDIIDEYLHLGHKLTIRQLYYQFVARDFLPNTSKSYNLIQNTINDARLSGMVDWNVIVDRTRSLEQNSHWNTPKEILQTSADCFRINTRTTQPYYIEVWIEKDALVGLIENICTTQDVPYLSFRGYVSQTILWAAAKRFKTEQTIGKHRKGLLIQLSDHDPSGINMTDDIQHRFQIFGADVEVKRIALTMTQIKQHNPPPNPAKQTDTRFQAYADMYGDESWELDALNPQIITNLVNKTITEYTDKTAQNKRIMLEQSYRADLQQITDEYNP